MRMRSRIKRLERKLQRHKPLPVVMFVNPFFGETQESKYQKYLDEGGDPKAEIIWFIYRSPLKEEITNPSYVYERKGALRAQGEIETDVTVISCQMHDEKSHRPG